MEHNRGRLAPWILVLLLIVAVVGVLSAIAPSLYRRRMIGGLRSLEARLTRDHPGAVLVSTSCQRFGLPGSGLVEPDFWEDFGAWFARMRGKSSRLDFYPRVQEGDSPAHAYHLIDILLRSGGRDIHLSYLWSPRTWRWIHDSTWEHPSGLGSGEG